MSIPDQNKLRDIPALNADEVAELFKTDLNKGLLKTEATCRL